MSPRKPKLRGLPPPHKGARRPALDAGIPNADDHHPPVFSFLHADRDYIGTWSWFRDDEAPEVLRFLYDISKYTWTEIMGMRNNGGPIHHLQPIASVCPEAQARITELEHDQRVEELFRFGIGHRKRLWGFAIGGVFYVLWWDRDHKVYPVNMD